MLSSHHAIMAAFATAAMANDEAWHLLVRTKDQFEHCDYKSAMMQRNTECSETSTQVPDGSKQALEEGEVRPGPSKCSWGASMVTDLEAVDKE